jgi:adenylate cyclase class IV
VIPFNIELEVKLDATNINESLFRKWIFNKDPYRTLIVEGYDQFYRRGEDIARLRLCPDDPFQLTIKKRKSLQSIRDRKEVDLEVGRDAALVHDFLELDGYTTDIKIFKKAHIFWIKQGKGEVVVSYYTAQKDIDGTLSEPKAYVEIEVAKGSQIEVDTGKGWLKRWLDEINEEFKAELIPLNQSLFELFS